MGNVCSLFFLCDLALPSKSQVTFGAGRPLMVAGILMGSPARMHSRSSAITSMLIEGGTVESEHERSVTKKKGAKVIVLQSRLTLNVFHQNLAGPRAGVRFSNVIDSDDPEAVAF